MSLRGYPVYRIHPGGSEAVRVGSILEYRRSLRSMNRLGLARIAQKLFAQVPGDIIVVGSESSLKRGGFPELQGIVLSAG